MVVRKRDFNQFRENLDALSEKKSRYLNLRISIDMAELVQVLQATLSGDPNVRLSAELELTRRSINPGKVRSSSTTDSFTD